MPLTAQQIDELRMPNAYQAPTGVTNPYAMMVGGAGGLGMYSRPNSGKPQGYNPDPRGMVDPEALQALAYGTDYDVEARRNAIAARIAENELAAQAQAKPASSGGAGADGLRADQFMTPYGPLTRNPDQSESSPLIGLMGVGENGSTFF